ncbi:uncharacterized protein [Spinacia oleracea]|uniref:Reverse transcriptase zinc-binding domain-containing protein n=1 Tax=Spinacia oleracea TaxID=3562 RepID=A0ABM3QZN5_SPIOL|nr:uncharacterized protein LOC130463666 [Spinacia oleracea]
MHDLMKVHLSEAQLCSIQKYSIKKAYGKLILPAAVKVYWASAVWCRLGQAKHRFITWLAVLERLNTKDRLRQFGLSMDDLCLLCGAATENHNHLFFGCHFSYQCWSHIASFLHISLTKCSLPQLIRWIHRRNISKFRKGVYYTFVWCTVYHIWKERNNSLWNNQISCIDKVCSMIKSSACNRLHSVLPKALSTTDSSWFCTLVEG